MAANSQGWAVWSLAWHHTDGPGYKLSLNPNQPAMDASEFGDVDTLVSIGQLKCIILEIRVVWIISKMSILHL